MLKFKLFIFLSSITFFSCLIWADAIKVIVDQRSTYRLSGLDLSPDIEDDCFIYVTSNDVVIDLQNYSFLQTNTTANYTAIKIAANVSRVSIKNGTLKNFTGSAIYVSDGCSNISLENIIVNSCNGGIVFDGDRIGIKGISIASCEIYNCNILNNQSLYSSLILKNVCSSSIKYCSFTNNYSSLYPVYGVYLRGCQSCHFMNCLFDHNIGYGLSVGCYMFNCIDCQLLTCKSSYNGLIDNLLTSSAMGFYFDSCQKCGIAQTVSVNNGGSDSATGIGFKFANGYNNIVKDCAAQGNFGVNSGLGFVITGAESFSNILESYAIGNYGTSMGYGILLQDSFNCCFLKNILVGNRGLSCEGYLDMTLTGSNSFLSNITSSNTGLDCCNEDELLLENIQTSIDRLSALNTFTVLDNIDEDLTRGFSGTYTALTALTQAIVDAKPETSMYSDLIVECRYDLINVNFQYDVSPADVNTAVNAQGFVNSSSSLAFISSGSGANGSARLETKKRVKYGFGHEAYAVFTSSFVGDIVDNSTQWSGIFDSQDGAAVGYSGTVFGILYRRSESDLVINQSDFNIDKLDGTGSSRFILNPANLNVYKIVYGWIGASSIKYYVLDDDGSWINFHTVKRANNFQTPLFSNPVLPIAFEVNKLGGESSNLIINSSSINAGTVGKPTTAASRFFSKTLSLAIAKSGNEIHIFTLSNKSTYKSISNKVEIRIASFGGGLNATSGQSGILRLKKGATVSGTSYSDIDSTSVMQFSSAGSYSASTGYEIMTLPVNSLGSGPQLFYLPKGQYDIILLPGETITVTAQSLSGSLTFYATVSWEEQF